MDTDALKQAASQVARENRLPVALVLAVIEVESGGDVFSWNPEPRYHYLWNIKKNEPFRHLTHDEDFSEKPPWDFFSAAGDRDAEWWGQQASWGPMQVMGAVAREYGFREHFPNLCGVLGLHYGAIHLSMLRDRFFSRYGWEGVAAAYNAGSVRWDDSQETRYVNHAYVDKIARAGGFA